MLTARYTTNTSSVLPTFNSGYQYTVNETEANGIYTVEISSDSDFTSCSFSGKTQLLTVDYLKVTDKVTTMANLFNGCTSLTNVNTSNWNTSNVTNMSYVFHGCKALTALDVSNFNTSNVTNMRNMFYNCANLTQLDVSNFNTSDVTDFENLFRGCSKVIRLDVSNFNTSNVTNMQYVFHECMSLTTLDLSNFNTEKVTSMRNMFYSCRVLTQLDVSSFNTSKVTNMSNMFNNCLSLVQLDLSNFDTSKASNTTNMFNGAENLIIIGMIYCSLDTVNTLSSLLPTTTAKQVYVEDVKSFECTEVSNITFIDYISNSYTITPPVALTLEDEILWDDSLQRYIIKRLDGSIVETDISSKFKIDLYAPYTMIYADNVTSISININRKGM